MLLLKPRIAVLDETDSGLDIDALKIVAKGVNHLRGEQFGALIITHYQRILNHIRPDHVHIMYQGRIVASGGNDLVEALEERGYDWVRERYGIEEVLDEQPASSRTQGERRFTRRATLSPIWRSTLIMYQSSTRLDRRILFQWILAIAADHMEVIWTESLTVTCTERSFWITTAIREIGPH